MNMLAIILLQAECVQDLSITELFHRMQNYSKTKLAMPVLAVSGSYYPALGGNITGNPALYSMKALAQNVRGIQIPNSGHWGPEEQPDFVIKMLDNFFAGNSTRTSK